MLKPRSLGKTGRRLAVAGVVALLLAGGLIAALYRPGLPPEVVESRWAGGASRFLEVDRLRVHYRDEGEGPALVLLHGFGASLHAWDGWVEELRDELRLVRPDLPGFGLTGPHPEGDYRTETYVDFVGRFLDRLGIESCHLAGSSMGGEIAWRFALDHPERVERLVLIDAGGYGGAPGSTALAVARLPGLRDLAQRLTPRFLVARALRDAYADDAQVTDELVDRHYELLLREGNRRALVERLARLGEDDRSAEIPEIPHPTLVMWGADDTWIPVEHARRFHREIPFSVLAVYDAGHLPMAELPEATARDLRAFVLAGTGVPVVEAEGGAEPAEGSEEEPREEGETP